MPNAHDDGCDCAGCQADEDRFWREQGGDARQMPPRPDDFDFDVSDLDDQDDEGPCSHVFGDFDGRDRCSLCGAPYNPAVHGHRVIPEGDLSC